MTVEAAVPLLGDELVDAAERAPVPTGAIRRAVAPSARRQVEWRHRRPSRAISASASGGPQVAAWYRGMGRGSAAQ